MMDLSPLKARIAEMRCECLSSDRPTKTVPTGSVVFSIVEAQALVEEIERLRAQVDRRARIVQGIREATERQLKEKPEDWL